MGTSTRLHPWHAHQASRCLLYSAAFCCCGPFPHLSLPALSFCLPLYACVQHDGTLPQNLATQLLRDREATREHQAQQQGELCFSLSRTFLKLPSGRRSSALGDDTFYSAPIHCPELIAVCPGAFCVYMYTGERAWLVAIVDEYVRCPGIWRSVHAGVQTSSDCPTVLASVCLSAAGWHVPAKASPSGRTPCGDVSVRPCFSYSVPRGRGSGLACCPGPSSFP